MKKTKGFEKNISIYIRGQDELALTFFDQIIYSELEKYLMTYESNYNDGFVEIEDKDGVVREIIIITKLKEDYDSLQIAMKLYRKMGEMVEDLECKIVVDDDIFIDGIA